MLVVTLGRVREERNTVLNYHHQLHQYFHHQLHQLLSLPIDNILLAVIAICNALMFSGILRRQAISVKTQKEELDDLALKFEESSVQRDKGALNKKLSLIKLEIS